MLACSHFFTQNTNIIIVCFLVIIIIIATIIIIIRIFLAYGQNIVFYVRKKRTKLPELGGGGWGDGVR